MEKKDIHLKQIYSFLLNEDYYLMEQYLVEYGFIGKEINESLVEGFSEAVYAKELDERLYRSLSKLYTRDDITKVEIILPYCCIIAVGKCYFKMSKPQQEDAKIMINKAVHHDNPLLRDAIVKAAVEITSHKYEQTYNYLYSILYDSSILQKVFVLKVLSNQQFLVNEEQLNNMVRVFDYLFEDYILNYAKYRFNMDEKQIYIEALVNCSFPIIKRNPKISFDLIEKYYQKGDKRLDIILNRMLRRYIEYNKNTRMARVLLKKYNS
ncbi:MAG: hypothetical protein RR543_02350 [Erysipelotrichales bacterium]